MNGIEKITGRIESDARKKAQEILEEARVQARSVTDNYARHAQTLRRELLDKAEDQVLLQVQRMTGAGELEGRKELQLPGAPAPRRRGAGGSWRAGRSCCGPSRRSWTRPSPWLWTNCASCPRRSTSPCSPAGW